MRHIMSYPLRPHFRVMAKQIRRYVYHHDGYFGWCWKHYQYTVRIGPFTVGLIRRIDTSVKNNMRLSKEEEDALQR